MSDRCSSTPGRKQLSHERIVQVAARAIREHGYQGLGVADIMKQAGLTHGGFYAHFDSRDGLLAEAAEAAGAQSQDQWQQVADSAAAQGGDVLQALLRSYLGMEHVHAQGAGCPLAVLAGETPRQADAVRSAVTGRVRHMAGVLQQALPVAVAAAPDRAPAPAAQGDVPDARALAVAGLLVGTLTLARAVNDDALRQSLLEAGRHAAEHLAQAALPGGSAA